MQTDIVSPTLEFVGKIALPASDLGEGAGKICSAVCELPGEDFHGGWSEHMETEKAEVVARAESGDQEFLFRFGGGGFFEDRFDFVKPVVSRDPSAADRTVVWQLAFMSRLDRRDRAFFRGGGC